jgi:hypothetical protein
MKNKFIALALVTLSIATTTVSCTKDDAIPSAKAQNVQTASITVPIKTEESSNVTGKNVDRGSLPITIDGINVHSVSTSFDWTKDFNFTLFADGTVGNEHSFVLDNVAVGMNNITAETTTDALPSLTSEVSVGGDVNNLMAKLRGNKPYAKYYGAGTANVVQGNPSATTVSPIALATKDGRNIAVFKLSDEFKTLGVKVVIAPTATSGANVFPTMTLSGENVGLLYWNPSVQTPSDLKLTYTVTLLDKNGTPLPLTSQIPAPSSLGFWLENHAATSTNTIYTVSQGALVPQTVTQQFTATWTDNDPTNGTIGN